MDVVNLDTIAAIATPPGNGGIGVVRISGSLALELAQHITVKTLQPRLAQYGNFLAADGSVIDTGICLYFPAPASYTGEDVIELQGHGGAVVMDMLLRRVLSLGARLARPGEFTERAFLNNKLDLAQAEAVADLIESSTEQSARSALNSMQGAFSKVVNDLVEELFELRTYVEAAIDFVDEDIDFLSDGVVENRIIDLLDRIQKIQRTAKQGRLLRDGMTVVLAGKPNAGKSSLLNALAGYEAAIVTDIAGTTRDVLRERIQLDGMPIHIIDTAGLRESKDVIEQEGVRRAHAEIVKADLILLLIDASLTETDDLQTALPTNIKLIKVYNKIDLIEKSPEIIDSEQGSCCYLSIKTSAGVNEFKELLKRSVGFAGSCEQVFSARTRHIDAINKSYDFVLNALKQLQTQQAGELVAEDLRQAQNALAEIIGQITTEDLLGRIFASFCIGK